MWIAGADWKACEHPRTVEPGTRVVLGFDGSVGDDATALVACTVEERPHVWPLGVWEKPSAPKPALNGRASPFQGDVTRVRFPSRRSKLSDRESVSFRSLATSP
jgi:poly(3-hydroxybutyrate) depolymerase